MKKIVIGVFELESNSLTAICSTRACFSMAFDRDMIPRVHVADYFESEGFEAIPTIYASGVPAGPLLQSEFDSILGELIERIPNDPEIAGVWLKLHGAMDVLELGSGDLEITKAVRAKVGPNVPVSIAFDMHADVDERIADYANCIRGYRTAPHTDIERTELHAAELLVHCIRIGYLPRPVIVKVPVIANGDSMTTDVEPGSGIIEQLWNMEAVEDILCPSLFLGNPWVDSACAGAAAVVVPNPGKEACAQEAACKLAQLLWNQKDRFRFRAKTMEPEEGIDWMLSCAKRPLFVSDTGDNITGGGSGDDAGLISLCMERNVTGALFAGITDRPLVEACENLQPGAAFHCELGGTLDPNSVRVSLDAVFIRKGVLEDWPAKAPVESVLIRAAGNDIIVSAKRAPVCDMAVFRNFSLQPHDYRFIVFKLGYLWPELYEAAPDSLMLMTRGSTCEVVEKCRFRSLARPIYPLDKDFVWEPVPYKSECGGKDQE
ncbi:MAG: M81 family metallopeptidase [Eubacteriales bacterium]|nr:M81 family metallopeptidase [Eubacteriales bacterium]